MSPPTARTLALLAALGVLACNRPMERLAGTPPPMDASYYPGTPDWTDLPQVEDILATSEYQPPALPCRACHDTKVTDPTPRKLTLMHQEIVFNHDEEHRWCFGCHNPDQRDRLRLADGKLIPFEQHPLLCGQCHGTILREWKVGVHGKRTGNWTGGQRYWMCAECHNPHSPAFPGIKPEPAPPEPKPGATARVASAED